MKVDTIEFLRVFSQFNIEFIQNNKTIGTNRTDLYVEFPQIDIWHIEQKNYLEQNLIITYLRVILFNKKDSN